MIGKISLPNTLHPQLAVNNPTNMIYASNSNSNTISVIDANNNIKNVKVGLHPFGIAINANTDKIYVANTGSNTVSVIDGTCLRRIYRFCYNYART